MKNMKVVKSAESAEFVQNRKRDGLEYTGTVVWRANPLYVCTVKNFKADSSHQTQHAFQRMAQLDRREILMAGKSSTYDGSCGAHVRMLYLELYHAAALVRTVQAGRATQATTIKQTTVVPFGCVWL